MRYFKKISKVYLIASTVISYIGMSRIIYYIVYEEGSDIFEEINKAISLVSDSFIDFCKEFYDDLKYYAFVRWK